MASASFSFSELALALGHSAGRRGNARMTELYARPPRLANANIVAVFNARRAR